MTYRVEISIQPNTSRESEIKAELDKHYLDEDYSGYVCELDVIPRKGDLIQFGGFQVEIVLVVHFPISKSGDSYRRTDVCAKLVIKDDTDETSIIQFGYGYRR